MTRGRRAVAKPGKRERRRRARHLAERILDLAGEGHSAASIASSTGLTEEFVREALEQLEDAHGDSGGEAAETAG